MIKNRTKWAVGVSIVAASLMLTGVAIATAPTGSVSSTVIGAGSTDTKVELQAKPGTATVVASFTFGPNSSTGWHTHPGRTLVTVKSGTFTVYHADDCEPMVYEPGDAFVELPTTVHGGRNPAAPSPACPGEDCGPLVYEPGDAFVELPTTVHVGRNETATPVELGVVFFKVPIGGSPRIDQPQPEGCDVT